MKKQYEEYLKKYENLSTDFINNKKSNIRNYKTSVAFDKLNTILKTTIIDECNHELFMIYLEIEEKFNETPMPYRERPIRYNELLKEYDEIKQIIYDNNEKAKQLLNEMFKNYLLKKSNLPKNIFDTIYQKITIEKYSICYREIEMEFNNLKDFVFNIMEEYNM
jgi:hypothetical protein